MSEENVEIVRSTFAAFEEGDLTRGLEWAADDLITHRVEPDNAIYHGKEGFLQATADWIEDFEEWTVTPKEFVDGGDSVLVRVHQTAARRAVSQWRATSGLCSRSVRGRSPASASHLREEEALEAAGLSA